MANSAPSLKVRTRALPFMQTDSLLNYLDENPLVFVRDHQGLIGSGEAAKLWATGPDRFAELQEQWSELVSASEIDDAVGGPGRGLIAFATFAFADQSKTQSLLIVPELLIGLRDGRAWVTQVWQSNRPEPAEIRSLQDLKVKNPKAPNSPVALKEGEISASDFEALTEEALLALNSGKVEKVVVARDLVADIDSYFDIRGPLKRLANRFENCWTYSIDGLFGASPELLVRVSHSQVSARVLAGTASRGTDPQIDRAIADALVSSSKNKREHAFAVDSLVKSLTEYCAEITADSEPFSLALPNLWHLASDVTAVLNENHSSIDLAGALHPTAAVAGTPTQAALKLIAKLEQTDRGRYAGPVGWVAADGDGEWAIALRGAQISSDESRKKTIRAFAGCGLVAESNSAAELAETELKFQPIRYALS